MTEIEKNIDRVINEEIDMSEAAIMSKKDWLIECPLMHTFFPGIYIRQMSAQAGSFITSAIHKTTHPFFVMEGKLNVFGSRAGAQILEAPYMGMTIAGTRRIAYVQKDCFWVTIHQLNYITGKENDWDEERKETLLKRIEADILEPHINCITHTDIREDYNEYIKNRRLICQQ